MLGIAYQLYQSLYAAAVSEEVTTSIVNVIIALILVFLYVLCPKTKNVQILVAVLHFIVLIGFFYFWKNFGGYAGTVPSFMCLYVGFIVALSKGLYQQSFLGIFAIFITVLLFFPTLVGIGNNYDLSIIPAIQRNVDYFIIGCIISFFIVYMKNQLLSYQKLISKKYKQLKKVADTLSIQNQELKNQQDELHAINDNLEKIIKERIAEIEKKNQDLSEYAFINAHMLRGPLSRVIGITNLLSRENKNKQQLQTISTLANDIDKIVREINKVVS
jgi:signal transduction histidine kinase